MPSPTGASHYNLRINIHSSNILAYTVKNCIYGYAATLRYQ